MNEYRTPPGFVDTPYIYCYDATGLTDGQSYQRLSLPLEGDTQFLLRRIAGLNTVATAMRLYDGDGQPTSNAPMRVGAQWPMPEIAYGRTGSGEILFDLQTVARSSIACGTTIYTSHLYFQGVKRRRATFTQGVAGVWSPTPWTYVQPVTVDWYRYITGAIVEPPRRIMLAINDYDFSLRQLRLVNTTDGGAFTAPTIQLRLYDADGRALSSAPVNQNTINSAVDATACFPVPEVQYPFGSTLQFDVVSNICNTDPSFPKTVRIELIGYRRIPK